VFCLSSDYEGMPNVILEAMAASLAIVATDAPGTVELVTPGHNGYLVSCGKCEDFDQAFLELKNRPGELRRMQKSSHDAASNYTWDAVARAYGDVCEKAVSG
jgi:glycosyltransferase involved in cell wall biosynthesis